MPSQIINKLKVTKVEIAAFANGAPTTFQSYGIEQNRTVVPDEAAHNEMDLDFWDCFWKEKNSVL